MFSPMFVVLCEPLEDKPDVYGPFTSEESANKWIENDVYENTPCPNDHYIHQVIEVSS